MHDGGFDVLRSFDVFWQEYPRKVAKLAAQKAYRRAVKRFGADAILTGLLTAKRVWQGRQAQYLPYPATFLNATDFNAEFINPEQEERYETYQERVARISREKAERAYADLAEQSRDRSGASDTGRADRLLFEGSE